jgi:hypothetical protein
MASAPKDEKAETVNIGCRNRGAVFVISTGSFLRSVVGVSRLSWELNSECSNRRPRATCIHYQLSGCKGCCLLSRRPGRAMALACCIVDK